MNNTRRSIHHNLLAPSYTSPPTKDNSSEIKSFYATLPSYNPTPLIPLPELAAQLSVRSIFIKAETSRLGLPSFKLLGASWAIRNAIINSCDLLRDVSLEGLREAVRENRIKFCAATDGNHGRAVAFMGRLLGVSGCRVFVPRGLDEGIIGGIEGEGRDGGVVVKRVEGDYDETVRTAHRFGEEGRRDGWMLIEAVAYEGYVDVPRWAVEGYTTMFHEIDSQIPSPPSLIIAPLGVGSLTQAIITHYKSPTRKNVPAPKIATIEPDTAATLHKSLKAGQSLSITTFPTIMAGLECGTVSSIAWPLLKEGVDISATISDWECHEAILYLKELGIEAGPCGAAALAGLQRIVAEEGLGSDDVVICICTEGARPYDVPSKIVESGGLLEEVLVELRKFGESEEDARMKVMHYSAQWLEYHDIDIRYVDPGTENTSLLAVVAGPEKDAGSALLVFPLYEMELKHLAANLIAFSRRKHCFITRSGKIIFTMISSVTGLELVLEACGKVDEIVVLSGDPELKHCCEEVGISVREIRDLGGDLNSKV